MFAQAHWKVLQGRYELIVPLSPDSPHEQPSETWIAVGAYDAEYLIKIWPFLAGAANDYQRALWDLELRTMYRVSSSPGAEECLLVIKDAGLDQTYNCFVMVMRGASDAGFASLLDIISERGKYPWLSNESEEARRALWLGFRRIAQGIQLLHTQSVLHRNVDMSNIILQPDGGPDSFRLGGFEWSVRIGEVNAFRQSNLWSLPADNVTGQFSGFRPETDWYGFGILASRCLLSIEALNMRSPMERQSGVLREIEKATARQLSDIEKTLLQRLVARNRPDRLTRGYEILAIIDQIQESLQSVAMDRVGKPLFLGYNPHDNQNLIDAALNAGFVPNPNDPFESFTPYSNPHCTRLSEFIQEDLHEAQIYRLNTEYLLLGRKLSLRIVPLQLRDPKTSARIPTWDIAYCRDVWDLRGTGQGPICRDLPLGLIAVRTRGEILSSRGFVNSEIGERQSWEQFLPKLEQSAQLRVGLARFHDFIRCTNQIELLMRDSELFQYREYQRETREGTEFIEIYEVERTDRPVMDILKIEGGMVEFLQREIETSGARELKVVLTGHDFLRFDQGVRILPRDCYIVVGFDNRIVQDQPESNVRTVKLARFSLQSSILPAPKVGWLRTFGMFGQLDVIRRRKEAIVRLITHSYLLKSLSATGQVYMDTGEDRELRGIAVERVDQAKQAVMKDVLRTRPIYALQGPPGTGKTTMVAHLLKQIFDDDPVAQVLITAQAHGAVDVLHNKVRDEAFAGVPEARLPLDIRLGRASDDGRIGEGSVQSVAKRVLEQALRRLDELDSLLPIQREWRTAAEDMLEAVTGYSSDQDLPEFCELVKRGASIVYCTTSAGDLEELARSTQFYDWAIIEEAGKCHGFDLALPLQAGHRWLLIGDQYQLEPYRKGDYIKAIENLEKVTNALKHLPGRASGLLDMDWIQRWEAFSLDSQIEFKKYALDWLATFDTIYKNCKKASGKNEGEDVTIDEPIGVVAGMLSSQYRMHPVIGDLISKSFYKGIVKSMTWSRTKGQPETRVLLPVHEPESIKGKSIVWLNTPIARESNIAREVGPPEGPRYTNPYEIRVLKGFLARLQLEEHSLTRNADEIDDLNLPIKLAILSPYSHQVRQISRAINQVRMPSGIVAKEALSTRRAQTSEGSVRLVHTVDSFQGNEADIIIISMVRNNLGYKEHGKPLGFLEDFHRLNVLLSRAQRLLVLIGSWDFFWQQVEPIAETDTSRELHRLKIAMNLLAGWFVSGEAIKLPATDFVDGTL